MDPGNSEKLVDYAFQVFVQSSEINDGMRGATVNQRVIVTA
jgi:hypothetical protein